MKKFVLFSIALAFCAFSSLDAQLFEKYKAKEAYTAAKKLAKFSFSQLLFVGTLNGEFDTGTIKIKTEFDFKTGKAELWVVMFNDGMNPDSTQTFAVLKSLLGVYPIDISGNDMLNMEIDLANPITIDNWMDSNEMAVELMKNSKFNAFVTNHPKPDMCLVGLFRNSMYDYLESGKVYWGAQIVKDTDYSACGINVETKVLNCNEILSVEEIDNVNLKIYPNPASDFINISYPNDLSVQNIELYDLKGNIIYVANLDNILSANFSINTNNLPIGNYYLNLQINNKWGTIPVKVIK